MDIVGFGEMEQQIPADQVASKKMLEHEDMHEDFHMENREIKINPRQIVSDLYNLDWSKVYWRNFIFFLVLHLCFPYGVYLTMFSGAWKTLAFASMLCIFGGLGVTMGAHRLWSHCSFKATFPLRAVLVIFQTLSLEGHIYEWTKNHRIHHKYSETDADPHNARRGFFFSHMGWMMYEKHPEYLAKGDRVYMKDLESDPLVMW